MNAYRLALGAAALTGVLVGAAMVATRVVAPAVSPVTLAFLRYLIGMAFLAIPLLATRWPRYALKDAAAIAVLGVLQFAVLIVLVNYALESLPAGLCALIFSTMPLATLCLALILRQETLHTARILGIILAIAGVAVSLSPSSFSVDGALSGGWTSPAAIIGATIVGAACSVLYRPYLKRYPALPTSGFAMLSSVIFLAVTCLLTGQPLWPRLDLVEWLNVVFMGFASGLGYYFWLWALARIDASKVVAFQALGPITAASIELLMQRQAPSMALCLSIALVVCGLLLMQGVHRPAPLRLG